MDIVACTDKNYIMPTGVMMYSVCVNNVEDNIVFHIVTIGVSSEEKRKLYNTVSQFGNKSVNFYDTKELDLSVLPMISNSHVTIATYFRLFLTKLLPQNLNRIIYLDGDIVVRQSLSSLWEFDIENCAVAAVEEYCVPDSVFERLQYAKEIGYFNAGVLLINLEFWRSNNLMSAFVDFVSKYSDSIRYHDQDVLNYVLKKHKKSLPIKYNLTTNYLLSNHECGDRRNLQVIYEAIKDCVILHFTGEGNPWCTSCLHPFRSSFFKYQAQTIWKKTPLIENRSTSWRIRNWLGLCLRKVHLLPELPPYGKQFISGLTSID